MSAIDIKTGEHLKSFTAWGMTLQERLEGIWDLDGFTLFAKQCFDNGMTQWVERVLCCHNSGSLLVYLKKDTPELDRMWIEYRAERTLMSANGVWIDGHHCQPHMLEDEEGEPAVENRFLLMALTTGEMNGVYHEDGEARGLLRVLREREPEKLWALLDIVDTNGGPSKTYPERPPVDPSKLVIVGAREWFAAHEAREKAAAVATAKA